jgi:hypothetical protein
MKAGPAAAATNAARALGNLACNSEAVARAVVAVPGAVGGLLACCADAGDPAGDLAAAAIRALVNIVRMAPCLVTVPRDRAS